MSVIVDDRDPQVHYSPGDWAPSGIDVEYMTTTTSSNTQGDTAIFKFKGTSVGVYGTVGPGNGSIMAFSIDQSSVALYISPPINSANSAIYHQNLWTSEVLPEGSHTLSITQNSSNPNMIIYLDYLLYSTTLTAGKTVFIDDNDTRLEYSPGWALSSRNKYLQHTVHVSQAPGCSVSLTFEGEFISLYAPITSGGNEAGFNASVVIDNGPSSFVTPSAQRPARTTTYNSRLFSSQLASGNHTMVITVLDEQPFYLDYFLVEVGLDGDSTSITSATIAPSATQSIPTDNPRPSKSSKSPNLAAAIGGAQGGIVLLGLLILGFLMWRQRARGVDRPGRQSIQTSITSRWTRRSSYLTSETDVNDADDQALRPTHDSAEPTHAGVEFRKPRLPPQIVYI
ncbi:hypothetical protein DFH09DRAFT_1183686 [Mycena vulgaris]|nr:hypothetical protein DFH09DRAFT_1183686 [Mycena vulgaris]